METEVGWTLNTRKGPQANESSLLWKARQGEKTDSIIESPERVQPKPWLGPSET